MSSKGHLEEAGTNMILMFWTPIFVDMFHIIFVSMLCI